MALGIGSGLSFSKKTFNIGRYFKVLSQSPGSDNVGNIFMNNFTSSTRENDDIVTYSMDIYLTDPGGFGTPANDPVSFRTGFDDGIFVTSFNNNNIVPQDTLTSISGTLNIASSASVFLTDNRLNVANFNVVSDLPSQNSAVFIKNLVTVHKANDGTVKETRVFDFSSSGNITMFAGSGKFQPGGPQGALFSKGNFLP